MKLSPVLLFWTYLAAGVVATLWPFNFLQYNLASSSPSGGLVFKQPAIAFTQNAPSKLARLERFTLELRLISFSVRERACILDYGTDEHHVNLRLQQENDQLDVWVESAGGHPEAGLHIPHVFARIDTLTITVSFDGVKLHAWINGGSRKTTQLGPGERLQWDSSATLALGSLVDGQNGWRGELFSLSMIDRSIEPAKTPVPASLRGNLVMSYDFTGPFRRLVPDVGSGAPNPLWIPERYTVPSRIILAPPTHYNWHTRWFVFDMAGNVLAFFPFGFLGAIIFIRQRKSVVQGIVITVLAAFLFSLSVEMLQAWLPTRNSSMVDLICNVVGAGIGTFFSRISWIQAALKRFGPAWSDRSVT